MNGSCSLCNNDHYLDPDDETERGCIECDGLCQEGECDGVSGVYYNCSFGYYPNPEDPKECIECNTIDNCMECSGTERRCTLCYAPYVPNSNGECGFCEPGYYYKDAECHPNTIEGCLIQVDDDTCVECLER